MEEALIPSRTRSAGTPLSFSPLPSQSYLAPVDRVLQPDDALRDVRVLEDDETEAAGAAGGALVGDEGLMRERERERVRVSSQARASEREREQRPTAPRLSPVSRLFSSSRTSVTTPKLEK